MAFALATYSALVSAVLTAVLALLVVLLPPPPQPAAARTSAAPAASAVGLESAVTVRRRGTGGWLSSWRWVLTFMGLLVSWVEITAWVEVTELDRGVTYALIGLSGIDVDEVTPA